MSSKPKQVKPDTLTEKEFCKRVGISRSTAMRQRKAGKLPHCHVGRRVLYLPRHVEQFFANTEENVQR